MRQLTLLLLCALSFFVTTVLVIYTYTQIDLNLTLFTNPTYQYYQKQLIDLGYFNRPLSTVLYLLIVSVSFILYISALLLTFFRKIHSKYLYIVFVVISSLCFLAYPAFSHDMFNYMFDAKIVTQYRQNPYVLKALDFPDDLWIRFMHWTHRTYPYGPLWIIITLPFSYAGFGKFVPTLFNFKVMFLLFHLGNVYLIGKITKSHTAAAFYALNPLVIIESVVSPHNESAMLLFLLSAFYFAQKKNRFFSFLSLIASGAIKYVTLIVLPIFIFSGIGNKLSRNFLYLIALVLLLIALVYLSSQREPYPWYFVTLIGVGALVPSKIIKLILISLSFGLLLRYAPYLYEGSYPLWVRQMQNQLFLIPVLVTGMGYVLYFAVLKAQKRLTANKI